MTRDRGQGCRAPRVSVVIPTRDRPALVPGAIESALAQTLADLEVVVVPAIEARATARVLSSFTDPRLRVLEPGTAENPSAARNRGIAAARGRCVALLDDDDRWMPEKLDRQLATMADSGHPRPVVSCRMVVRSRDDEWTWPRDLPGAGESVADYLFRRRSLFGGGGYLQSSTLLAARDLFLEVPFREDLDTAEDLDWAIRVAEIEGVGFEFSGPEPLTVWNVADDRPRASNRGSWRADAEWIAGMRGRVSPRAYASYLLTWVSADAARSGGGGTAFVELLRRAFDGGRPSSLDLLVHVGHWVVPPRLRRALSVRAARTARGFDVAREDHAPGVHRRPDA